MYNHTQTIFNELLNFLPFKTFDALVGQHKVDRYKKKFSAKTLLSILMYAQITGKDSLRDIETSLTVQQNNLYHRGIQSTKRSTLAYNNNHYDYHIFEQLFYALVREIQQFYPNGKFKYHSLDSTTISLSLGLFSRAKYRTKKGAVKMHVLLENQNTIPEIITITTGKTADITVGKLMRLEEQLKKGDFIVFDKGYVDYKRYKRLDNKGIFFVTRPRKNMDYIVIKNKDIGINGVVKEQMIEVCNPQGEPYQGTLRLIEYISPDNGNYYQFITNNFEINPKLIALLYKKRRDVEIFFKFIKQNLKIKSFLGTSENAVRNQLWIAMIYYLIVCYIKFKTKVRQSLLELCRIFSVGVTTE